MKIDTNQIPSEGLTLTEEIAPLDLDLETETIKFSAPIKLTANVFKVSNVVSVNLRWDALIHTNCSRCLNELETDFKKNNIELNYQLDNSRQIIDLDPDIRDEIILDYPIRPLCKPNCKGLCPKCGKNLNEGKCSC